MNIKKEEKVEKPKEEEVKKTNSITDRLKAFNEPKKEENKEKQKEEEGKKANSIADKLKAFNNPVNENK